MTKAEASWAVMDVESPELTRKVHASVSTVLAALDILKQVFDDFEMIAYMVDGDVNVRMEYELLLLSVPNYQEVLDEMKDYLESMGGQIVKETGRCVHFSLPLPPSDDGQELDLHMRMCTVHKTRDKIYIALVPCRIVKKP